MFIDRGDLVPDEITIGMVEERLGRDDCQGGALLDGFPRTILQAEALDGILTKLNASLKVVLSVAVPDDVLVERASGSTPIFLIMSFPVTDGFPFKQPRAAAPVTVVRRRRARAPRCGRP